MQPPVRQMPKRRWGPRAFASWQSIGRLTLNHSDQIVSRAEIREAVCKKRSSYVSQKVLLISRSEPSCRCARARFAVEADDSIDCLLDLAPQLGPWQRRHVKALLESTDELHGLPLKGRPQFGDRLDANGLKSWRGAVLQQASASAKRL